MSYYSAARRRYFPKPKNTTYKPDFARYEQLKAAWIAENPKADPIEYQEAMRKIAWRCGI